MSRQEDLNNLIANISDDLDGFIGASVVDLDTGMSLASASKMANFDLDVASAYNSEMVKAKYKTIKALGLDTGLEDMLLTLDDQLHLIRMLDDQSFIYVAVDRHSSNLALLRTSVKRRVAEIA
ncbi:hypothetical protein [Corynebacterium sp. TAE3-ERU16]|uniref:hypothetical protein n=1 Tax=Corynebacterium sp. TAE3-ERU16 TaxID=2849493 RepID=UPI001C47D47C|nr:hypothetical protein [Corynebacterium sp. TAE3-ERU16]MBV7293511.1 hypothetical protein [Corynebacterium sp. TAE3-ERU16]